MNEGQAHDEVLERLSLSVRMELAKIIDPRHDRDPDMVMAEIRQICQVMVNAVTKIVDFQLDRNPAVGIDSATAPTVAAALHDRIMESDDAEPSHPQDSGDSATATKGKRKRARSQVPLP